MDLLLERPASPSSAWSRSPARTVSSTSTGESDGSRFELPNANFSPERGVVSSRSARPTSDGGPFGDGGRESFQAAPQAASAVSAQLTVTSPVRLQGADGSAIQNGSELGDGAAPTGETIGPSLIFPPPETTAPATIIAKGADAPAEAKDTDVSVEAEGAIATATSGAVSTKAEGPATVDDPATARTIISADVAILDRPANAASVLAQNLTGTGVDARAASGMQAQPTTELSADDARVAGESTTEDGPPSRDDEPAAPTQAVVPAFQLLQTMVLQSASAGTADRDPVARESGSVSHAAGAPAVGRSTAPAEEVSEIAPALEDLPVVQNGAAQSGRTERLAGHAETSTFGEHLAKIGAEALQAAANPGGDAASAMRVDLPAPVSHVLTGLHGSTASTVSGVVPHAAAPSHPVVTGVQVPSVPIEIGLKSLAGVNRFDIRLDPDDLGQIDVRLDISEGQVRAHIVVERPEALLSLQREASHLERALEQAGFRTGEDGVSLSLRQQAQGEGGGGRGEDREAGAQTSRPQGAPDTTAPVSPLRRYGWGRASGVDRHI